ncbi:hypothetical protein BKA66DRAFT_565662 [Pyrenochaeta sp. MPI-SDFR-AT-0127]|nr:hypothetical protein BKA66DRAFT_565662 [Pyrenochaeta sp. MPI-SDFR-AT-0127]
MDSPMPSSPPERLRRSTSEGIPLPISDSQDLSSDKSIAVNNYSPGPTPWNKQLHGFTAAKLPLPVSRLQQSPVEQDQTTGSPMMPPVGIFSTKSPIKSARRRVLHSTSTGNSPQTSGARSETPQRPTVRSSPIRLATTTSPSVSEEHGEKDSADSYQDPTTELSIALLLETLKGAGAESSIIGTIKAAQSSLAQLSDTYQRILTAPINPKDGLNLIKALQVLQQSSDASTAPPGRRAMFHSPGKPVKLQFEMIRTQLQQAILPEADIAHQQGFKAGLAAANVAHAADIEARIQAAHDKGYKSGITHSQDSHLKDIEERLKIAYDIGLESGAKKATETHENMNRVDNAAALQLTQCKEWLRGIIEARNMADKAQLGALITRAEMVVWLGNGLEDVDDDKDMAS